MLTIKEKARMPFANNITLNKPMEVCVLLKVYANMFVFYVNLL